MEVNIKTLTDSITGSYPTCNNGDKFNDVFYRCCTNNNNNNNVVTRSMTDIVRRANSIIEYFYQYRTI